MKGFSASGPRPNFGDVGIAAAARTGHNVKWHDIVSGPSDRPGFSGKA